MDTHTQIDPRLLPGSNNPPDPLILEADERVDTANKWITERPEITDAEMADKAQFFIDQVGATFTALNNQRLQEGRDFEAVQKAKYTTPLGLLNLAKEKLQGLKRAWLKKEQDRLDAQTAAAAAEARRIADEAAAAVRRAEEEATKKGGDPLRAQLEAEQATERASVAIKQAAAAPARAVIKGTFTQRATGLRTVWLAEVTGRQAAFKHYKKNAFLNRAIDEALASIASAESKIAKDEAKAPPGVRFYSEQR